MAAVLRKLRADLRSDRVQRLFILLVLLFATAALTAALTVRARGGTAWEDLYRQSDGAHAWIYGDEALLDRIAARPEVRATSGPFPMIEVGSTPRPELGGNSIPVWLQGIDGGVPDMGRPLLTDGRWVEAPGEVVLPRSLAREFHYSLGGTLDLQTEAGTVGLRIVGLAVFAGQSPFSLPQIAWTVSETISALGAGTGGLPSQTAGLGIQLESREEAGAFIETVERELPISGFFRAADWNDVRAQNDEATEIIVLFLGIFSVFALASTALVVVNASSGRVLSRYRDIGLMKAVGFTPRQVVAGLLIELCGVALVAAVLGVVLGNWLVPLLDDPNSEQYQTTPTGHVEPLLSLAIGAGVVLLVGLATLIPAWRAGRVPAVRAIHLGGGQVSARPSRVAAAAARLRFPTWAVLGIKDAFDRPVRSWLTVAALTVSVVTVTFVVTAEWTIRSLTSNPALIGEPFDIQIEGGDRAALEAAIKADPNVEVYFERADTEVAVPGREEEVVLAALGTGYEQLDWVVAEGRLFDAPGEAIAGYGFLEMMNVDVGDSVELPVLGKTLRVKIVGQYRATENGGRWLMTSAETAGEQIGADLPLGFAVVMKDGADADNAARSYQEAAGATEIEVFDHGADGINAVRGVLGGLGVLLLFVGATSLVNAVASTLRERRRDLGILKAVGLTPRQAIGEVLAGAAWLTAIALAVGIPLGLWVSVRISDVMGKGLGWGPGLFETPPPGWVAMIAVIVLGASALAATFPAVFAARLPANEALRSE